MNTTFNPFNFSIKGDSSDPHRSFSENLDQNCSFLLQNPVAVLWLREDASKSLPIRIITYPKHLIRIFVTATFMAPAYHLYHFFKQCFEFLKWICFQNNEFSFKALRIHLVSSIPVVGSLLSTLVCENIFDGISTSILIAKYTDRPAASISFALLRMIPLIGTTLATIFHNWKSKDESGLFNGVFSDWQSPQQQAT